MQNTKEKILQTALSLFAKDGYEAVSVSRIADALNITKGALYKHYTSKRNIFDSIILRMERQDAAQAEADSMPCGTTSEMPEAYQAATLDGLIRFSRAQFIYWTQNPFAAAFRKMLTLEQFRNEEMSQLYQQYLAIGPLAYVTDLLSAFGCPAPQSTAMDLYAPMFFLYSLYDGAADKEKPIALLDEHLQNMRAKLNKIIKQK